MTTFAAFCKNGSFTEHVLRKFSSACSLRDIEGTCIVSGNGEDDSCACLQTLPTTEVNQKLAIRMPRSRRHSLWDVT